MVLAASTPGEPNAQLALRELCEAYWYALYAFLRRDGFAESDAMDLVQGFLADVMERGELNADPERGRFRSYIIGALRNFRRNAQRAALAQKRGGHLSSIGFEDAESRYLSEPADTASPEVLFERRWAMTLLDRAIEQLAEEYRQRNRENVFAALKVKLSGGGDENYAQTAAALGMTESAVKVSVHRMRARMRELIRVEVAQTVSGEQDVDGELSQLFAALAT